MTSEQIRKMPLQTELAAKTLTTMEGMALDYQVTQLVFLREIAAQLAEMNEFYRSDWMTKTNATR